MTQAQDTVIATLFDRYQTGWHGLGAEEVQARQARYGLNSLPEAKAPGLALVFFKQFLNPLIYILLIAAAVSLWLGEEMDAIFIGAVLLVNGLIGTVQEFSAARSAAALRSLAVPHAVVIRDEREQEVDARALVPGDIVKLEAGVRVPADVRLLAGLGLEVDESAMTGESRAVGKDPGWQSGESATIADRREMAFAGTVITKGRATGLVTETGLTTEIGKIAEQIQKRSTAKPPLLIRMERFTRMIGGAVVVAVICLALIGIARGMGAQDMFMMAVGLAVSAIPEGLPISISVALAIGMRRMARRKVIVRHMPAVEALGSCTLIATDKTGTLTVNSLTVTDAALPGGERLTNIPENMPGDEARASLFELLRVAVLTNEAHISKDEQGQDHRVGDPVDLALLGLAGHAGADPAKIRADYPEIAAIPYEPELKYSASFHRVTGAGGDEKILLCVKGAPSTLEEMCGGMLCRGCRAVYDRAIIDEQKEAMTGQGLRVLAFASGYLTPRPEGDYGPEDIKNLTFLGLVGMQDPVRPEVPEAIAACRAAGIKVVMVTGDDAKTATAIAKDAGFDMAASSVVTGVQMRKAEAEGDGALDELTKGAHIYARVEPAQKLDLVNSMSRNGHFVAVTGDGVNDAPALRHAHVGVAMGKMGTDIARDSADIILTDDNFASIVAGIQEGRVAYANIRKVVFLLVSTGAAEVAVFLLAMMFGTPVPLLPVQLLWLNLVTNGIQDVALVFEKEEGDELQIPPRDPKEPLFNPLMIKRIMLSALTMGAGGFAVFWWLLSQGYGETEARNLLLLLLVLFENFQALNSRSERRSVFHHNLFANPFLLMAIVAAQGLHILAMYLPGLSDILDVSPVSLESWLYLLLIASSLFIVIEVEKWMRRRKAHRSEGPQAARQGS